MAYARRSLTSSLVHLTRRLHPSLPHLVPHDRDPSPPPSPPSTASNGTINPTSRISPPLPPIGLEFHARRYSSRSGSTAGGETFLKDDSTDFLVDVAAADGTAAVTDSAGEVAAADVADVTAAVADSAGEVAAAAAESYPPVAALQHLIGGIHEFTGLNWWAAIVVTTILIRSATVPLMINQLKVTTKLSKLRPELEELKAQMNSSMDPQVVLDNQKKMKKLFIKHGVTPFSPLKGLLIQGPIFISFYLAIRTMVEKVPSFKEGGAFWFTDLTTPDPLYALPVITAMSFLVTVELNMQEGMEGNPMAGTMKKFFRVLALFMVPFTVNFPKAIFFYWATSNIFSLAYGAVLKRPPVRRFLNLPDVLQRSNTSQLNLQLFREAKHVSPTSSPSSYTGELHPPDEASSSSKISQRIEKLEKAAKERGELKK